MRQHSGSQHRQIPKVNPALADLRVMRHAMFGLADSSELCTALDLYAVAPSMNPSPYLSVRGE